MGKIDGKIAIVTGASRGIGKSIAQMFAAEGATVVCAARSLKEGDNKLFSGSLETTVAEIEAAGGKAMAVQTDLTSEDSCIQLVARTKDVFGTVDILVNDAAIIYLNPVKDTTIEQWDTSWSIQVRATFILTHEVLKEMIKQQSGAIINISSGAAVGPGRGPYKETLRSDFGDTVYGAQKAAIERFTQGLAQEVYPHNISVNALAPSVIVKTPGGLSLRPVLGPNESKPPEPEYEPPEMMAKAALLLASEQLDKITGRVTYSQAILKEFGWIKEGKGRGITNLHVSGYSQM